MSELIAIMRPAGVLGDRSDASYLEDAVTAVVTPQLGALTVKAAGLQSVAGNGSIDYLKVAARATVIDPAPPNTDDDELTWTLGGAVATESVGPWTRGGTISEVKTSNLLLDPAGDPWTWTNAMLLTDVGANVIYTLSSGETLTLRVADVWVEVWGTSYGPFVHGSGLHGSIGGEGEHGDVSAAGLHGGMAGDGEHGAIEASGIHDEVTGGGM